MVFSLAAVAFLAGGYAVGGVPGAALGLCPGSVCRAVATWIRVAGPHRRTAPAQAPVSVSVARPGP